ncbi:transglutaminase domain-containing protein [Mucilaginibacter sp. UR6-11]|uniref:transglutaminase domain-containing protein n=1 Tax=Mucilaginibacter sp. UR6-11 TaxID=1435644 RepID=UPI001E2BA9DA|nr:transglutaminase domain-containing protein [Mucilaginibacter sp. UR6-11]MCC8427075.1 DUF3857 domain-containing protein [Mucilaginibacter sp. UR6-11]
MRRLLLAGLCSLAVLFAAKAQDTAQNKQVHINTEMTHYPGDPSAHAFMIGEYGSASVQYTGDGGIRMYYYYRTSIKILDEEGFKFGTVEIPIYGAETIFALSGSTNYKDNNGKWVREKLTGDKIFRVQENKYQSTIKFAMPSLKPGCEIEYTYTITSPYFDSFHSWRFETDLPKVHSEFQSRIPVFLTYNISIRGALNPTKSVSSVLPKYFPLGDKRYDCRFTGVSMDNIPAFVREDYMTAPKNFTSALYFDLAEFINPNTDGVHKVADQWSDIDKRLKNDDYFADQLKPRSYLKDRIAAAIAGKTTDLDKARAVYVYLQKNMKWNEAPATGSADIRKALDKHVGSAGDINLALVAALKAAGVNADAVLISTRDHGVLNKVYPVITDFNYVIAKADIGDKTYLLDATDPQLGFGMLPLRCLNDQGRVFSLDKPSYWIDINPSQNENTTYTLNLTLQDNGKLKGTFTNYFKGYAAYSMRKVIKKFNTVDEYVENLDQVLTHVKIIKSNISNLDSLNLPLSETYEVEIDGLENSNDNRFAFSPYLFNKITTNPFKLADRIYPVDWGMPSETKYILQVQLPEKYTVENPPEDIAVSLPDEGGNFVTRYIPGEKSFTFSHVMSLKKSVYKSEEYASLKELYNKIILAEKTEMVFRKKI